jgi:anti-sigma factor RsiW
MANNRGRRLMQEALDDRLSPEALQELHNRLNDDPQEADEFDRLRAVDRTLKSAPHERAPGTLALRIMARLAEELQNPRLHHLSGLALAVGLGLVALTLMPLLIGIGWLLVTSVGSASFFNTAIQALTGFVAAGAAAMASVVQSAQALMNATPVLPAALVTLIPVGVFWLRRLSRENRGNDEDDE